MAEYCQKVAQVSPKLRAVSATNINNFQKRQKSTVPSGKPAQRFGELRATFFAMNGPKYLFGQRLATICHNPFSLICLRSWLFHVVRLHAL